MVKIYLDPGHGGNDSGAVGNGLREKDLTLTIARKIRDQLLNYQNVQVRMSRDSDKTMSLKQRTDDANSWGADYLISVHINAGGGTGFESYIYNGNYSGKPETNRKRNIIHDEIMKQLPGVRDRGKKEANFHMLRESRMQAVLTENLFIDNKDDADKLKQDAWLDRIAQGHVNGLVKVFNLKPKESPQPDPKPNVYYRVIAGSFQERANAEKRIEELQKAGFESFIDIKEVKQPGSNPIVFYRVVAGSFQDRTNAEKRVEELQKAGFDAFIDIYEV